MTDQEDEILPTVLTEEESITSTSFQFVDGDLAAPYIVASRRDEKSMRKANALTGLDTGWPIKSFKRLARPTCCLSVSIHAAARCSGNPEATTLYERAT